MILLIKLILAHLIGDFLFQPASWVKAKETKGFRAYQLYLHALIHLVVIMLLVWDWDFLKWAALLAFIHMIIDILKIFLQNKKTKRFYFFADQLVHLLVLYLFFCWRADYNPLHYLGFNDVNILKVTMLIFLMLPASIFVKMFISKWAPAKDDKQSESLQEAGKYIGMIERLFVFTFVLTGHWEAIGFLLAAKSIFRFGDLKESKDRKLTEYMLIGTLVSFGLAILAGLVVI
nr:DUF3307 domain-containing protein [Bacteroidota bacterium]